MVTQSEFKGSQPILPVLAELVPRGDGTFILKPRVTEKDTNTWVTPRQAGEVLGNVSPKTIYKMLGKYLVFRRPLPRKILVSLRSVMAFKQATLNTDFWDDRFLRNELAGQVKAEMQKQTEESAPRPLKRVG